MLKPSQTKQHSLLQHVQHIQKNISIQHIQKNISNLAYLRPYISSRGLL